MANQLCLRTLVILLITLFANSNAEKTCSDHEQLLIGDGCYDPYLDRGATYNVAEDICKENGGQVALVPTLEMQKTLTRIALKQRFENYWVTTKVRPTSGGCHTLKYQNDFEISEEHCDNAMFYICEFDFEVSNSSRYGRSYFQFSEDRRKFSDAKNACKRLGGKMAEIYSEGRHDMLKTQLRKDRSWARFSDWQIENLSFG